MNRAEAERKLDDYLMKGIVFEIFWADEAKALAVKICEHAAALKQTEYAPLIYRLQIMASDLETLAVAKLFDSDTRTRSIPNVLSLISDNMSVWQLKDRVPLESFLMNEGHNESTLKSSSDTDLIKLTIDHYRQTLPHPANASQSSLSAALKSVRESRNRVHAHNEAIDATVRTRPTWGATQSLNTYAKDFVRVIAMAFLGLSLGPANYYLSSDAARTGHLFERLLKQAKLID
ncbi:MAG TPA: hypothetical protein VE135_17065 [Pyrinomonadaceae bacterium]|nr:hypothetical protein [Pyrinomonadaceae bacterium]